MSSWCAGADGTDGADGDGDGGDAKCDGTSGLVPVKHTLIHLSIHPSNTPSVYRFEKLIWESGKTVTECQQQSVSSRVTDRRWMKEMKVFSFALLSSIQMISFCCWWCRFFIQWWLSAQWTAWIGGSSHSVADSQTDRQTDRSVTVLLLLFLLLKTLGQQHWLAGH